MDKVLESHRALVHGPVGYLKQGIQIVAAEIGLAIQELDSDPQSARVRLEWILQALEVWQRKEDPNAERPHTRV